MCVLVFVTSETRYKQCTPHIKSAPSMLVLDFISCNCGTVRLYVCCSFHLVGHVACVRITFVNLSLRYCVSLAMLLLHG